MRQRETHRRLVAFDAATGQYLRAHRDTLGATGPRFCVAQGAVSLGARLAPVSIYRIVKRLIRLAGLQDQLQGPHDLRRNFATYYNRNRRGERVPRGVRPIAEQTVGQLFVSRPPGTRSRLFPTRC